eukprot:g3982.t1
MNVNKQFLVSGSRGQSSSSSENLRKKRIDHPIQSSPSFEHASKGKTGRTSPDVVQWIDRKYVDVFHFETFNSVQVKCLSGLLDTNESMVIAAPTACGKTTCFELAIVRLISHAEFNTTGGKIVYVAPSKALCQEKYDEWINKFEKPFGLHTELLTGDSERRGLDKKIARARIILTTPEKFDSFTRRWNDKQALIGQVRLLLIDEVHAVHEERGGTLEAIVARVMQTSAADHCIRRKWPVAHLRIIALSATLPNARDIADWLRCSEQFLVMFGDEARPVKLETHVLSFPESKNAFLFFLSLQSHIHTVIREYSDGCPTLVFCPTRKNCETTAARIAGLDKGGTTDSASSPFWKSEAHRKELERAALLVRENRGLAECIRRGVCFHSGGLSMSNRSIVEQTFRSGSLAVCCTTTTLAQGVNLPARLVVVMSTQQWKGAGERYVEYPRSMILQMIGRAGRPQFDDQATGVIMTRRSTTDRYKRDMQGGTIVESSLRRRLAEFINSEIALGSISSVCLSLSLSPFHGTTHGRAGCCVRSDEMRCTRSSPL